MNDTEITPEQAARVLAASGRHLNLLHTYFDDAREQGLPPHHSINAALGRMAELQKRGSGHGNEPG